VHHGGPTRNTKLTVAAALRYLTWYPTCLHVVGGGRCMSASNSGLRRGVEKATIVSESRSADENIYSCLWITNQCSRLATPSVI
jgi:hypothetical protein